MPTTFERASVPVMVHCVECQACGASKRRRIDVIYRNDKQHAEHAPSEFFAAGPLPVGWVQIGYDVYCEPCGLAIQAAIDREREQIRVRAAVIKEREGVKAK